MTQTKELIKKSEAVLEVEAEELPDFLVELEKKMERDLIKKGVTKQRIDDLRVKYSGLKLRSLDDHETYLELKAGRREVRAVGIDIESACKNGRSEANEISKAWIEKQKSAGGLVLEIQDPIDDELKLYEDHKAQVEVAEKKKREDLFRSKQEALIKYGASYQDGKYVLEHLEYDEETIRDTADEFWEGVILPKYKKVFDDAQAELVAEENRRKEEAKKLKEQQEAQQKQQEEMDRKIKEMEEREAKMKAKELELELEEKRKQAQKENDLWRGRLMELNEVGWNGQEALFGEDVVITYNDLINKSDADFSIIRDAHNKDVEVYLEEQKVISKQKEEERIAAEAKAKQEAIEAALQREREAVAEKKRLDEIKKQQEDAAKAEELAQAGDKAQWQHFLSQLESIQVPEMKSPGYRKKSGMFKEKLEEIKSL